MILPKDLTLRAVSFARLGNGGHAQTFRNDKYGITVHNLKESRDHAWVKTYTIDRLPGQAFHSGKEVAEAFKGLEF